jgi:8-oxo-dGTP pyrophosphatase MutT (NUDIX family)
MRPARRNVPRKPPVTDARTSRTRQYAALPVRKTPDGDREVLLVTSRETQRWVIPKGWPMAGKAPHQAAAREAFEEAGIRGKAGKKAIGQYQYWKRLDAMFRLVRVDVFKLKIERLLDDWPEKDSRKRAWFSPESAARMVDEPGLRAILESMSEKARKGAGRNTDRNNRRKGGKPGKDKAPAKPETGSAGEPAEME